MRISAIPTDPGYRTDAAGTGRYDITLNGKRVKRCVTADTDSGYVIKYLRRNRGWLLNEAKDGVRTTRVFGQVHIYCNGELLA